MKNIEELLNELLDKIIGSKANSSKGRVSRTDSLVNAKTGPKASMKARKSRKHHRRARRVFTQEREAISLTDESLLSVSALIKALKEKGHANVKGTVLWSKDLFSAVKKIKNISERQEVISYLVRAYEKKMVASEYTAYDIATVVSSLPKRNRARLEEELKNIVINAVEREVRKDELARFVNEVLPAFKFRREHEKEILGRLNIVKRISEETIMGSRDEVLDRLKSLKKSHLHFAMPVLKNVIVYIRLNPLHREGPPSHEEVTFYRIVKESLKEAVCGIERSHKLYPLIRRVLKDTFYLSTSNIEEIDKLYTENNTNPQIYNGIKRIW